MKKLKLSKPKVLIKSKSLLAEGPIWNYNTRELTFVDILTNKIYFYKNKKKVKIYKFKNTISSFLPSKNNQWIACCKNKIFKLKICNNKIQAKIVKVIKQKKNNRLNDAAIDSEGRLWVSTMDEKEISNSGNLLFFRNIYKPVKLLGNFIIGNGIDWSPCKKIMYFSVSDKKKIYKFNYQNKSGKITKKKIFANIPYGKGNPDGLCVDSEGLIWVACWEGSCIIRFKKSGKIDKIIEMPITRPTSLCFGGKNMKTLFITSARKINLSNKIEKNSGNIFYIKTNVKGIKTNFFNIN